MTKRVAGVACAMLVAGTSATRAVPWRSVVIGGGGFVTGLAASSDGGAVYMRTDVGGAYRWDATDAQWRPITDSLPNDANNNGHLYGIGAIAVDPADANRVFLACGKYNYSNPSGVYFCGDTSVENPAWTVIDPTVRVIGNGGFRSSGERLAVDPCNPDVVYFGTYNTGGVNGLRKYVHDGASWSTATLATPLPGAVDHGISFVAPDPAGGSVSDGARSVCKFLYIGVYGATDAEGGVFASADGGASWTKVTGLVFNKPFRGEVDPGGTLYVTGVGNVAKVARGSTAFTSVTPVAGLDYTGLAVDQDAAGTVMVAEVLGSERLWRTTNGGGSWVVVNRIAHATEPDGTRSVTSSGKFNNIADILITPNRPGEVWACDFAGVQRTQNIKDDASASDWYTLQRNHEELVALMLRSAPSGAPLLSAVADCNGYVHDLLDARPGARFNAPAYLSTTALDFSECSGGSVWGRVGDLYYWLGTDADRMGGTSLDGGRTWASFGQLDARPVTNSPSAGWEAFDVGHYVRRRKAGGASAVTLVLRAGAWQQNQHMLRFSSKEGVAPPQLVVNGVTTLTPTADATVCKGATNANYGASVELQAQNYYEQANYTRWSYLRFEFGGVGVVTSAFLRVHRLANGSDTTAYSAAVHASSVVDWVEGNGGSDGVPAGELTWANRPALHAPPAGQGGRIALSATDAANLVWLQESGAVWRSDDRGVTWTRGTRDGAALTVDGMSEFTTSRNALAADRVATDTFYLYAKTGGGTVYRSTDGGATWTTLVAGIGAAESYKLLAVPGMAGAFWYVDHNWNVAARFKYWNGSSLVNVPGITDAVDFAFGKAAPGRANPVVYVRKSNGTYWFSPDAAEGTTFTWTQVEAPAVNCQPTVLEGCRQRYGRLYVGTGGRGLFHADVMSASAGTIEWTGGGGDGRWNNPANWDSGTVPGFNDTAVFASAGLSANQTLRLDANQHVARLVFRTTTAFTIGHDDDVAAGHALTLTDLDREDVAGTEGTHVFAAPVNLAPDGDGNSTWTVNGSGELRMNAVLGATGATTFVKMGTGTFNMCFKSPTYAGPWQIVEGNITASNTDTMKGNATIGGTAVPANLTQSTKNALYNNMNITVLTNGTFNATDIDGGRVYSIHAKEGGVATIGNYFYGLRMYLTGGRINGGTVYNGGYGQILQSHAGAVTAVMNAHFMMGLHPTYDATIDVADGSPAIDLLVTREIRHANNTGRVLYRKGAGTIIFTQPSTYVNGNSATAVGWRFQAGRSIFNNTTGSAVGRNPAQIDGGAVVGGTGFLGGAVSSPTFFVLAEGSSAANLARISPGSVDATSGASLIGTLTVGDADATNAVLFANHSRLVAQVDASGNADRLTVHGTLDLSSASAGLELEVAADAKSGTYVLASATDGIRGTFAVVAGLPSGATLAYTANTVELTIPPKGTALLIR